MKGKWLLVAYALSGVAALAYELAWMRELSTMLGSTAYASGTMLSAYMTGLGLGAIIGTRVAVRTWRPMRMASWAEVAVAVLSVLAFLGIRYLPGFYFDLIKTSGLTSAALFLGLQFAMSFVIMALPTMAMGATYPLVMRAVNRDTELGTWSGKLYAVNTLGAIAGSLLATFVFIPTVGIKGSLVIAAVVSLAAAIIFSALATNDSRVPLFFRSAEVTALLVVVVILLIPARTGSPLGLGQAFYYRSAADFARTASTRTTIFESEGIYSHVAVVESGSGMRTLHNGALDEGTDNDYDRVTTTMLSMVPAMSAENTRTALVVGLGTGFTSQTYYDLGFDRVTTVEINPDVIPASEYFIGSVAEDDPRWDIVVDDARAFILTNPTKYDAITSEPSWPWSSGVAALFTQEFMEAAKSRLNDGGVYCQWLPNYILEDDDVAMMYKTMRQVFDRVDVWSVNFPEDQDAELLLIGYNDVAGHSVDVVKGRLDRLIAPLTDANPLIAPQSITPYPRAGVLAAAVDDPSVPLNVDDHSTLEYRVFWNFVNGALSRNGE
ncbi:MAG: fused MFS/spermidine synthase [Coriobacteriia bacterium]|nr:fused MFS/spermidine synthase [Coriobacteriia bacterium]